MRQGSLVLLSLSSLRTERNKKSQAACISIKFKQKCYKQAPKIRKNPVVDKYTQQDFKLCQRLKFQCNLLQNFKYFATIRTRFLIVFHKQKMLKSNSKSNRDGGRGVYALSCTSLCERNAYVLIKILSAGIKVNTFIYSLRIFIISQKFKLIC